MNTFARLKSVKAFYLSIAAAVICCAAYAESNRDNAVVQYTPHDRLYSVAFSGDFGEAVGESGLVLQSTDSGKTWAHEVNAPTKLAMFSVAIAGSRTIAVGQQGLIMVRDDRKKWHTVEAVTNQRLLRVSLNKSGLAVAVGAFGTLLKSTDNGDTWTELKPDWATLYKTDQTNDLMALRDEPTLYVAKVFDDGSILIGGEYGQLNLSKDGGATWTAVFKAASDQSATPPSIFGMNIRDDNVGYAVGQNGLAIMTNDAGKTWTQLDAQSQASLFDVNSTPDGHVFAVGMRAGLVSADAGKTWQPLKALDLNLNWYSGLSRGASMANDSMIAVGHSGRVIQIAAGSN